MDTKEGFKRQLRDVLSEIEGRPSQCLTDITLIDYQQGRLGDIEREQVQSHLVQCPTCRELFQEVCDFFEPSSKPTFQEVSAVPPPPVAHSWVKRNPWRLAACVLALAMLILIGVVPYKIFTLQKALSSATDRQNRDQEAFAAKIRAQEKTITELRQDLKKRSAPMPNAVLMLQFSGARRSASVADITVPDHKQFLNLQVRVPEAQRQRSYGMALTDPNGELLWRTDSAIRPDEDRTFSVHLGKDFLPAGEYALIVYEIRDGQQGSLGEPLSITRFRIH